MKTIFLRYWQTHMAKAPNTIEWRRQRIMVVSRNFFLILLVIQLTSCKKIFKCDNEYLTHKRENLDSTNLRLDGFYFEVGRQVVRPRFFYSNGINLMEKEGVDTLELEMLKSNILDGSYYNWLKDIKYTWGLVRIKGNVIEIERLDRRSTLECYSPIIRRGIIQNDTTIAVYEYELPNESSNTKFPDTVFYKFRAFPKPDSTNSFIE